MNMKTRLMAMGVFLLAALSCSTTGRLQTQVFDDGIYSRPAAVQDVAPSPEEMDNLLAETHASQAYILSAGDTLYVPEGKSIRFSKDNNIITIWDTPQWAYEYSWAYRPWYMWDYWWDSSWYYGSWHYRPWYSYSWYHAGLWHWDPWPSPSSSSCQGEMFCIILSLE